jgi:ABC-type uncharacterized transport system permease subunit
MGVFIFIMALAVMRDTLTRSWRIGRWRGRPAIHSAPSSFLLLLLVSIGFKFVPEARRGRIRANQHLH